MRILHYIPGIRLEQGGVVRTILDLCTLLSSQGHQIHLMCYQGPDIPAEWLAGREDRPKVTMLNPPAYPLNLFSSTDVETVADALRHCDVFHLHGPWLNGNVQFANQARRLGVPYVLTLHGMLNHWPMNQGGTWRKRLFMKLFGRQLLEDASIVHGTSAAEIEEARPWLGAARTKVIPCPVDLEPFRVLPGPDLARRQFDIQADQFNLLFLSRIHPQKGLDIALRAMAVLRDQGINARLIIAGHGDDQSLASHRQLVEQLQLADHVSFVGLVVGAMKLSLFQACDVFVHPTRHENFGLVLIEAMACGSAVVTTRGTNIWRELQSAGVQIVDLTPHALAEKLVELSKNAERRNAMRASGRQWVERNLDRSLILQQYEIFYSSASNKQIY